MEPIFPGMDPYLEAPALWPDVYHRLTSAISDQIQPLLSPRYIAAIEPYVAMETIEIVPVRRVVPDIAVIERERASNAGGVATAIAPAPLTGTVALEFPTRYHRIEIRTVGEGTLVTAIEILSPVNKRPGVDAADAYERKRREIFNSDAHLLEIDLLRGGRRPALLEPLPDAPYFIFLSRAEERPLIRIWPLSLQEPIPVVPIPLQWPDPEIPLDLNNALARAYRSARYDLRVDYRQSPPPPELTTEDATWVDGHLRAHGLRPG
jgi:hypothetical protein